MMYEFNVNGYVFTVRELKSGKNYRIIMKKVNKILNHENKKEERDNNLMHMSQMPQMQEMVIMPVKHRIEEKANIKPHNVQLSQNRTKIENKPVKVKIEENANNKPHNVELSQEKTNIEKKLFFLGFIMGSLNLITIALYTMVAILLRICKNHKKDSNYLVVNYNAKGEFV